MMMFKTWGYITMYQALQFTSDFKLGHYMKLPPRIMFGSQVLAIVIAGTTQLGVQSWMFTNIKGMCTTTQPDGFICPNTEVFGTASIVWGVIGPQRQFSKGQIYYGYYIILPQRYYLPIYSSHFFKRPLLFLPPRCCGSFLCMARLLEMAQILHSLRQLPRYLRRNRSHPAGQRCQLRAMGDCWVYLPIRHPQTSPLVVDEIQLCLVRRSGFRGCHINSRYLFLVRFLTIVAVRSRTYDVGLNRSLQYPRNSTIGATNIGTWWGE